MEERPVKKLTIRYAVSTVLLVLLIIAGYSLTPSLVSTIEKDGALISAVGAQRMHSQRIAFLAERLVHADDAFERERVREDLKEEIDRMAAERAAILTAADALMDTAAAFPVTSTDRYLDAARRLADTPDEELSPDHPDGQYVALLSDDVLRDLDAFGNALERGIVGEFSDIERRSMFILGAVLILVVLTSLLVVYPSLRRLRKSAETIRNKERYFRALIENARDIVTVLEADGTIRYESPAIENVLGYAPEERIDRSAFELIHPDDREHVIRTFKQGVSDEDAVIETRFRVRKKDGSWAHLDIVGENMLDDPFVSGVVVNARDVTDRELAFAEREKERLRYKTVIDQTGQLIYDYDLPSGKIEWFGAIKEVTGYAPKVFGDFSVKEWEKMIHPRDRKRVGKTLGEAERDQARFNEEYRFKRKGGAYAYIHDRGVFLTENGAPTRMLGVMEDVTERVKAEERAKELNELRDKFIGIVAHQLRTPLSVIRWNLDMLLQGEHGKLKRAQEGILKTVHTAEVEVIRRVNEMLAALDVEEGRVKLDVQPVMVDVMWNGMWPDYKNRCKTHEVKCAYRVPKKKLDEVMADPMKLRLVIEQLTDNALTFTPAGGRVEVRIKKKKDGVRFEVEDTGIGIPKAEQKRIFGRFYRASNASVVKQDASGVGLFLAKYFIEAMNGRIGFTSREGKGSTFWFELPFAE